MMIDKIDYGGALSSCCDKEVTKVNKGKGVCSKCNKLTQVKINKEEANRIYQLLISGYESTIGEYLRGITYLVSLYSGQRGGETSASNMTPSERSKRASVAAQARWKNQHEKE